MKFKVSYKQEIDFEVTGFVYQNETTSYVLVDFDCHHTVGAHDAIIKKLTEKLHNCYKLGNIYPQEDYEAQIHITAKDGSALSLVDLEDLSNDTDLPLIIE